MGVVEVFEILRRRGVSDSKSSDRVLGRMAPNKLAKLDEDIYDALASEVSAAGRKSIAGFDFWPNGDLAASDGCDGIECREERVDRLSRFAAMWADSVYIPSYFGYRRRAWGNDHPEYRMWLIGSVNALFKLEPCLRAGIVKISADSYHICPNCQSQVDPGIESVRHTLGVTQKSVADQYRSRIRAHVTTENDACIIHVYGPEDVVPHGQVSYSYLVGLDELPDWLPLRLRERAERGELLDSTLRGRSVDAILDLLIHDVVEDIVSQRLSGEVLGSKYLTDRPIDAVFLRAANENESFSQWNSILAQFMQYEMPILTEVPLQDLISLRSSDYEAFFTYRDSIKRTIKDFVVDKPVLTGKEAAEVYEDLVVPELNKMNRKLQVVTDKFSNQLRRNVVVAGATLCLGLSSALLMPALAISAAGASPFLAAAAKDLMAKRNAESELAGEDFFFLWKAARSRSRRPAVPVAS